MLVNKIFFPCSQKMRQVYTRSEDTIIVEWFSTREHNVLWFKDRKQAIKDIVFALKKLRTHPECNFDRCKHKFSQFRHTKKQLVEGCVLVWRLGQSLRSFRADAVVWICKILAWSWWLYINIKFLNSDIPRSSWSRIAFCFEDSARACAPPELMRLSEYVKY